VIGLVDREEDLEYGLPASRKKACRYGTASGANGDIARVI